MITTDKPYIKALITYSIVLIMFTLDQWTKYLVIKTMPVTVDINTKMITVGHEPYKFLSWLYFTHVVNFGSAFSTFFGQKFMLIAFAGLISLGLIVYERSSVSKRTKVLSFSIGFLLAGAFGNLFDRIRLGYVTDFLDLRWNGDNVFAIFNVADISINFGIYLLIYYFFFQEGKIKQSDTNMEDEEIISKA